MNAINDHQNTYYYKAIEDYYRGKVAERSKLPYMNHINEGIIILDELHAPMEAIEAFCLHPLFQGDLQLKEFGNKKDLHSLMGTRVMQLVMEYRNIANNFLAPKMFDRKEPKLSPIENVNWMLLADKIQNYKDFLKYQKPATRGETGHTMSRSRWEILDNYFQDWLKLLAPNFGFTFDKEIQIAWEAIDREVA